jgi:hypothetical protein
MSGTVPLNPKRILLIVGGGIAAYKVLDLCRLARRKGLAVRAIMTAVAGLRHGRQGLWRAVFTDR